MFLDPRSLRCCVHRLVGCAVPAGAQAVRVVTGRYAGLQGHLVRKTAKGAHLSLSPATTGATASSKKRSRVCAWLLANAFVNATDARTPSGSSHTASQLPPASKKIRAACQPPNWADLHPHMLSIVLSFLEAAQLGVATTVCKVTMQWCTIGAPQAHCLYAGSVHADTRPLGCDGCTVLVAPNALCRHAARIARCPCALLDTP